MFERGGHAGIRFRYRGADTGNRWRLVRANHRRRRSGHRITYRHGLFRENAFYFRQGGRCQNLNGRRPNLQRWKHVVSYRNTNRNWPGFRRRDNFAVRWTGRMRVFRSGHYRFSVYSDDGSKLWIDNRYTINNDGLHAWRNRAANRHLRAPWRLVRLEMFGRGGHAGIHFRYRGADTGNRWRLVRANHRPRRSSHRITYRHGLFRENAFYFRQGGRCQNLRSRRPNMQRWKHVVNYRNTNRNWPGFRRRDNFAVRWTGRIRVHRTGHYRLSIYSDDGSKLWIDNRYTINNDGLHGWRNRETTRHLRAPWRLVRLEMFERGGHAGIRFRYRGADTGNRWRVVRASGHRSKHSAHKITYRHGLFRENAFYFRQGGRCQNLHGRRT